MNKKKALSKYLIITAFSIIAVMVGYHMTNFICSYSLTNSKENSNSEFKYEIAYSFKLDDIHNSSFPITQAAISVSPSVIRVNNKVDTEKKAKKSVVKKATKKIKKPKKVYYKQTVGSPSKKLIVKKITKRTPKKTNESYKERLNMLSRVISGEYRNGTRQDMLYVGSVVLNRIEHKKFPKTMRGVIFAPRQYSCTRDGNYNKRPSPRAISVAKYLLKNGSVLPKKVIWQSQFKQGRGVYVKLNAHYYCY